MPDATGLAIHQLVQRFYLELWNRFDAALIPVLLTPDITIRGAIGRHVVGHVRVAEQLALVQTAFPDFECRIDELVVDGVGQSAFARVTARGTHHGPLPGLPPTGRPVSYDGAARFGTRAGRIADIWMIGDIHALIRRLRV